MRAGGGGAPTPMMRPTPASRTRNAPLASQPARTAWQAPDDGAHRQAGQNDHGDPTQGRGRGPEIVAQPERAASRAKLIHAEKDVASAMPIWADDRKQNQAGRYV